MSFTDGNIWPSKISNGPQKMLKGAKHGPQKISDQGIGLPCLRNLVNVYVSSINGNYSVYTELPELIFFHYADR